MAVLLEEQPLEHLGALKEVLREVPRAACEVVDDRVRLGDRPTVVKHERRHAQRRIQLGEQLGAIRAVNDAQLVTLVVDSQLRQQQPHLVAVARDLGVVEQHRALNGSRAA